MVSTVFSRYPVFVITWWITGTMAIACYTAAFVWTMEMCSGKWKIYLGMSMNYSWPVSRLIIAGLAYSLRDWHWHLRCKIPFTLAKPTLNCNSSQASPAWWRWAPSCWSSSRSLPGGS